MPKGRKKRRDRGATAGGESAKFKKITYHAMCRTSFEGNEVFSTLLALYPSSLSLSLSPLHFSVIPPTLLKNTHTHLSTDSASPDEDSESVCSSQDGAGSVMSEDGMGVVMGGVEEEVLDVDVEFQLGEYIDQLSDKK